MSSPSLISDMGRPRATPSKRRCVQAEDMLEEAVLGLIAHDEDVPAPSPANGRPVARLPALTAAKLELYRAMRQAGLDEAQLARGWAGLRRRSPISSTATTSSASNSSKPRSLRSAVGSW